MGFNFEEILFSLNKMQSYEDLLKSLVDIGRAVKWPYNTKNITVLRTNGYLKNLMKNLYLPYKAVVDASLSIFASCTVDVTFTREATEKHDLLSALHNLFELYIEEDRIKGRIYEILGNICKHSERRTVLNLDVQPEFVTHALEFLKRVSTEMIGAQRSSSETTIVSVLRFLRLLLHDFPDTTAPQFLKNFGILKVVGSFFVEASLGMENNENILHQVVQLIHKYIHCGNIHFSIEETIRGESVIYACSRMIFFSQRIPRIMDSLMKIGKFDQLESRPQIPDICDWIIEKVKNMNIQDSKDEYVGYMCCLCFMLLDRCSEQQKKFLPQLIKVLKVVENPSYADVECFILIIMVFNKHCGSDANIAKDLLDNDIVRALVQKLKWVSGQKTLGMDFQHRFTKRERLENLGLPYTLGSCDHPHPTLNAEYSHVNLNSSGSSNNDNGEMFVCSSHTRNKSGCPCSDKNLVDIMKSILKKEILDLIDTYFHYHHSMPEMASEELITAMLNCSVYFGRTRLYRDSICDLVQFPVQVVHLMRTTVVEKLYDMHQREFQHDSECAKCVRIKDTGYEVLECFEERGMCRMGVRLITYELVIGGNERKAELSLSIPYIFRTKAFLAHFLLEFDGLKILLAQFLEDGSSLKRRIIKALHVLASQRLNIADPTQVDTTGSSQAHLAGPSQMAMSTAAQTPLGTAWRPTRTVTLKLDDGSILKEDRNFLTEKSWYFNVLLSGNFREREEEEVALHDVPTASLRYMLLLLKHPDKISRFVGECDLDLLLDTIVLTDRHGQDDLCSMLMNCVVKHRMSWKTVAAIYRWSIETKLNLLRAEAVTFALVHSFDDGTRVAMFDSLFGVGCTSELLGDMHTILEMCLRP